MNAPKTFARPASWATSRAITIDALIAVTKIVDDAKYASCDDDATEAERESAYDLATELADTVETLTGTLQRYRDEEIDRLYVRVDDGASDAAWDAADEYNDAIERETPTVARAVADRKADLREVSLTDPVSAGLGRIWL